MLALTIAILLMGTLPGAALALEYALEFSGAAYMWKEHIPEGTPKELGPIVTAGIYVAGAPLERAPHLRLRLEGDLFLGVVKYDTFSSTPFSSFSLTPVSTRSAYIGWREEVGAGWRIDMRRGGIEPFLAVAYREWFRSVGSNSGAAGYPENYRTAYGRIGLRGDRWIQENLTLIGTLSFDPLLWAEERVDWSRISGEKLFLKNGKKPGWTVEFGARGNKIEWTLYWKATRFEESNRVSCRHGAAICIQPKSEQDIIGIKMGLKF